MELATEILVRRLAQSDAAWLPLRRPDWRNAGAILRARGPDATLPPLYQGVADGAERMRYSRAHGSLVSKGLLTADKPAVAQFTALGVRVARALTWRAQVAELREALDRIAERAAAGDCLHNPTGATPGDYVPEPLIAGVPWGVVNAYPFRLLSVVLLPALRAGLCTSISTQHGQAFYALPRGPVTDEQLAEVVDATLADTFDDDAAEVWTAQLTASRGQIFDADAAGELGFIPAHAGTLASLRRYDDLAGVAPLFPHLDAAEMNTLAPPDPERAAVVAEAQSWLAATKNVDPATYPGYASLTPAVVA
jgi:hypothetical protein